VKRETNIGSKYFIIDLYKVKSKKVVEEDQTAEEKFYYELVGHEKEKGKKTELNRNVTSYKDIRLPEDPAILG